MAWIRPPRLQSEYALRMIRQVTGASKPLVIFLALLLMLASGVSGNAAWGIVQRIPASDAPADFTWLAHVLGLLVLPLFLLLLWLWARAASERVHVAVIQDDNPPPAKALILFLSPPGAADKPLIETVLQGGAAYDLANRTHRESFKGSWRMPLEAVAYHLGRLKYVVVIPSKDSDKSRGTHHDLTAFRELTSASPRLIWRVGPASRRSFSPCTGGTPVPPTRHFGCGGPLVLQR